MFSLSVMIVFSISFSFIQGNTIINVKLPTTKIGFILPYFDLDKPDDFIVEGQDVIFRLIKLPKKVDECLLTTQDTTFTINLKPGVDDNRYVYWSASSNKSECGARIKSVTVKDSGRWRLKAVDKSTNRIYQSFFNLRVKKSADVQSPAINIKEGLFFSINMTENADYCEITNPSIQNDYNIYDKCNVTLSNATALFSGTWTVKAGLRGKMDEVVLRPNVNVLEDEFDVGYNSIDSKINLYCNWKNPKQHIKFTFCKFSRVNDKVGFHLQDGLSNGAYSYYGNGVIQGDCGMTIEKSSSKDFSVWKCSLGYYVGNVYNVKESIIPLKRSKRSTANFANNQEEDEEILSGDESPLTISCIADFRIKYCVLHHPNGTIYSMIVKPDDKMSSWKSTGNLDIGECKMLIHQSSKHDSGTWKCQMGSYDTHSMDKIKSLTVRVGDTPLVAVKTSITAEEGSSLTIKCISVSAGKTLKYCRFTMPDGNGFSISEDIKKNNAIDGLYWYNGTSLADGDCQVTIKKVFSKHIGKWTCAAQILDYEKGEGRDHINIEEPNELSIASISGIAAGAAGFLILVIGGFIYYKKKRNRTSREVQSHRSSSSESVIFPPEPNNPVVTIYEEREQPSEPAAASEEAIEMQVLSTQPTTSAREETVAQI